MEKLQQYVYEKRPGSKMYYFKSTDKPFKWYNVRYCLDPDEAKAINAIRLEYVHALISTSREALQCQFVLVGSRPDVPSNDIDYTVDGPRFIDCVKEVAELHRQNFHHSLGVVFDVNLYASAAHIHSSQLTRAQHGEQLAFSFMRVKDYLTAHKIAVPPRLQRVFNDSVELQARLDANNDSYDTVFYKLATNKNRLEKLRLYSSLKVMEPDAYRSIGAYYDVVEHRKDLCQEHRRQSVYDNFGFICACLDQPLACCTGAEGTGTPSSPSLRGSSGGEKCRLQFLIPKLSKYVVRICNNLDPAPKELHRLAVAINRRRKRGEPLDPDHKARFMALLGLDLVPGRKGRSLELFHALFLLLFRRIKAPRSHGDIGRITTKPDPSRRRGCRGCTPRRMPGTCSR